MRPRRQKVIRPHVVAIRRAATDARPIGEPQPAPFGLFLGHFQPFPAPQPLDPLVIHRPPVGGELLLVPRAGGVIRDQTTPPCLRLDLGRHRAHVHDDAADRNHPRHRV